MTEMDDDEREPIFDKLRPGMVILQRGDDGMLWRACGLIVLGVEKQRPYERGVGVVHGRDTRHWNCWSISREEIERCFKLPGDRGGYEVMTREELDEHGPTIMLVNEAWLGDRGVGSEPNDDVLGVAP